MSKFSKMLLGRFIISASRFFGRMEIANRDNFASYSDTANPFSSVRMPRNSLKSTGVINSHFPILGILRVRAFSEILFSVIKSIVVFMVYLFLSLTSEDESVHFDGGSIGANSIKTLGFYAPKCEPIPLTEPIEIFGVNDGVLSLRKWDKPIGWVRRLSNRMPFNSAFWHGLTSSKVLQLSRYSIILLLIFCSVSKVQAQAVVSVAPVAHQIFLSTSGAPLVSGCVTTSITGTSTPLASYTDSTGATPNSNPIILGADGGADIWLTNAAYRFTVVAYDGIPGNKCAAGVTLYVRDGINAFSAISTGANLFLLGQSSDPAGTAGEMVYRNDIPCFRFFTTFWDCVVRLTDTQTLSNKTLLAPVITAAVNTAGHYLRNNGTSYVDNVIQSNDIPTSVALQTPIMTNPSIVEVSSAPAGIFNAVVVWGETGDQFLHWNPNTNGVQNVPKTIMLASNYTNSTTTFSNVSDGTNVMQFTAAVGRAYTASCHLYYQAAATGGLNIQWVSTQGATSVAYGLNEPLSATAWNLQASQAFSTSLGAVVTTATTIFDAIVSFGFVNGGTGATINLQAKSSAAVALTIQSGSYCVVQ